jgi:hypothetical protein
MEVKLLGLTFRVEVVVLCILLGWILGAHLFCSCVKITPYEGFQMIKSSVENMLSNASFLDYKMSAGIELKKNPEKEVVGFMEDFKKEHESVGFQSTCKA